MLKGSYSSLRQRTGSHVRKPRRQYFGHVIRAQNLCSVRAFLKVLWTEKAEKNHGDDERRYNGLDWQDSGGVHDSGKRLEELERNGASFCESGKRRRRSRQGSTTKSIRCHRFLLSRSNVKVKYGQLLFESCNKLGYVPVSCA